MDSDDDTVNVGDLPLEATVFLGQRVRSTNVIMLLRRGRNPMTNMLCNTKPLQLLHNARR